MHIVQVHHEKVPVRHYGGTERVIEALATELVQAGHRVTLMCYKGDYEIPGVELIDFSKMSKQEAQSHFVPHIPKDADLVHYHVPAGQDEYASDIPYLCTLHGNEDDLEKLPKNTVCISKNHAERHGRKTFVYNGLIEKDIPLTNSSLSTREYFSFLGKASLKRKGLHNAKEIAKAYKTPLHVGGGKGFSLFGSVKYLGSVDNDQKYKLLGNSKGLLFPIEWEEPFGLVMIEAMFSGAPVFAFDRGSVAEVLGQEGHQNMFPIGKSCQELIQKIKDYSFDSVSPQAIRDYAAAHFSAKKMMEGYVAVYERLLAGEEI